MQPECPYRFTHLLGSCPVGKAWAAVDSHGRFLTVTVLDGPAAADPRWRDAFANAVTALAQTPGGHQPAETGYNATHPWVAYGGEEGNAPQRLFQSLGQEYRAEAAAAAPVAAQASPVSGAPAQPAPGLEEPTQQIPSQPHAARAAQQPWSVPAPPVSGAPMSPAAAPTSVPPAAAPTSVPPAAAPTSVPPHGTYDPFTATGRRIAPVRPEPKRRGWILIAAGALALALVAGTAGFFLAGSGEAAEPGGTPSASASLPPFEATQFSINKAKFEGELAPLAEPWLTRIGGCAADNEVGGPKLPADEERHVFCRYGGASLHFALYPAGAQKDAARAYRQQLNLAGGALAPGLREATRATGGVTGASGSYIEYAFKGEDGRTICGIWWDRDDVEGALYVETLCEAGIAGNWDALRDLWRRNS